VNGRTSDRKPPGVGWEPWVDHQIRLGMERGEFDNLSGSGRPLDGIDEPHDDAWWIKRKLEREGVSVLPPTLAVRKELDDARMAIAAARSEADVRTLVAAINERIVRINRLGAAGPPSTVMPLDVERTVRDWHDAEAGRRGRAPRRPSADR
jgi:DnaJ homologue, subfamily C, member 28, conserved domain